MTAKVPNRAAHPKRSGVRENAPWVPSGSSGQVSNYDPSYPHSIGVYEDRSGGHMASYEHVTGYANRHTSESEHYQAGPFRTPTRAMLAGEALANRVALRGSPNHYVGRTEDDLRYDG